MKKLLMSMMLILTAFFAAQAYTIDEVEKFTLDFQNYPGGPIEWTAPSGGGTTGAYAGAAMFYTKNFNNPMYPYHPEWVGKQILGVMVTKQLTKGVGNFKVFVINPSASSGDEPTPQWQSNQLASGNATNDNGTVIGWFDKPYDIVADRTVYVGYSFEVTEVNDSTKKPFPMFHANKVQKFGTITGPNNSSWDNASWVSSSAEYMRALPIYILMYDPNAKKITAEPIAPQVQRRHYTGQPIEVELGILNRGTETIDNIGYSVTMNGTTTTGEKAITPGIKYSDRQEVLFSFPALSEPGTYPTTFTIDKINGEDNPNVNKSIEFNVPVVLNDIYQGNYKEDEVMHFHANFLYPNEKPRYDGYAFIGKKAAALEIYCDSINQYRYYPEELEGMQIVGVKATNQLLDRKLDNFNAFVIGKDASFGDSPDSKWETNKIAQEIAKREGNDVIAWFRNPVTIEKGKRLWVGYDFDVLELNDSTAKPFPFFTQQAYPLRNCGVVWSGKSWLHMGDPTTTEAKTCAGVPITIFLMDPNHPEYGMRAYNPTDKKFYVGGDSLKLDYTIENTGRKAINEVEYSYILDGTSKQGKATITPTLYGMEKTKLRIVTDPVNDAGDHQMSLTITKVNGNANNDPQATVTATLPVVIPNDKIPEGAYEAAFYDREKINYGAIISGWPQTFDVLTRFKDSNLKNMNIVGAKVTHLVVDNLNSFTIYNTNKTFSKGGVPDGECVPAFPRGDSIIAIFEKPIPLTSTGTYIGYQIGLIDDHNYDMIPYSSPKGVYPNSLIALENNDGLWLDLSSDWGCATITAYLTGDITPNSLKIEKIINRPLTMPGDTIWQELQVVNCGGNEIKTIDYSYTADGVDYHETLNLSKPIKKTLLMKQYLTLPLHGFYKPGSSNVTLTIDKINGEPNGWKTKSVNLKVSVAQFRPTHRPIMEEGTGIKCGYCPRGMLALSVLAQRYPQFIAAAYHAYDDADDPMQYAGGIPWKTKGFPTSVIDRGEEFDPYWGTSRTDLGSAQDYEKAVALLSPANLDLATKWNDAQDEISVTANARFAFTEIGKTYKLGYIVTIDSLSHPGDADWEQVNYYKGDTRYLDRELLSALVDESFDLTTYNHVVIEASTNKGITNSLPTAINVNELYSHDYTLSLKDNELLENPADVHVIVLLIDNEGYVRNARVVKAGEATVPDPVDVVGINDIIANPDAANEVIYYDLTGRRVNRPQHGIFIKSTGKTVEKVML